MNLQLGYWSLFEVDVKNMSVIIRKRKLATNIKVNGFHVENISLWYHIICILDTYVKNIKIGNLYFLRALNKFQN